MGPQRGAHGDLAPPGLNPREREIRHVGARDQQNEPDRTEEHQQCRTHTANGLVQQRQRIDSPLRIRLGICFGKVSRDGNQLLPGLLNADVRLPPGDHPEPVTASQGHVTLIEAVRSPQLGGVRSEPERCRRDPDDRSRNAIQSDRPSQDVGVAAVQPLPQVVTEDCHRLYTGEVFLGVERPSPLQGDAEQLEEARCHLHRGESLGTVLAGQRGE